MSTQAPHELAPQELAVQFRDAMAAVCTPVSVVTAMDGDRPHGTTVSAFASLSMSPPSVLASLDQSSDLLPLILSSGSFGMNVLASHQAALAGRFARKGQDKFLGADWTLDHGVPRLAEVAHWIAAEVLETVTIADRIVVFGRVASLSSAAVAPLTYHDRSFGTHAALAPVLKVPDLPPRLRALAGGWG